MIPHLLAPLAKPAALLLVLAALVPTALAPTASAAHPPIEPTVRALVQASEAAAFHCPMHPEVKSDKPAKCSKCGMKLLPDDA